MIDCIVIGAGPGGIVSTKELLESGINNVVCVDESSQLGGVFSNSYDSLYLTSSAIFSMFSDFWVGDGNEHHFWTKAEVLEYWKKYADHFGVTNKIRLRTKVVAVSDLGDSSWEVKLSTNEVLRCKHLILAVGNNNVPSYPAWRDQLTSVQISHAKDYRNPHPYAGKRVLVVGGGESASDIALEISRVSDQCWVSLRHSTGWVVPRKRGDRAADISTHRGFWNLPRKYGKYLSDMLLRSDQSYGDPVHDALVSLNQRVTAKKGILGTYGTKTVALPEAMANYGCIITDGITKIEDGGRTLATSTGEILKNIDAIVFCTGYTNSASFMPEGFQKTDPRSLYKHMFHAETKDRIAWVGWARPAFGSQFPIMEMQARLCGEVFSGKHRLPSNTEMCDIAKADSDLYLEQFESSGQRIRSLVDYFRYMGDLATIIGCQPPIIRYLITKPRIWLRIVYGPMQATQFRLRGPGKKVELSQDILIRVPVSEFNHVVKAGLKGRVKYALQSIVPQFLIR